MIWKEFLATLIRFFFVWAFGVLVSRNVISPDVAAQLTDSATGYAVLFLLLLAPLAWSYLKTRFNLKVVVEALNAAPGTPLEEVKKRVLSKHTDVSPL